MKDIECPYCGHEEDINHDDGFGYEESVCHEMQCYECEKYYTFYTSISYSYDAQKEDCLNGEEHNYKPTMTYPIRFKKMRCTDCDDERAPTLSEWAEICINYLENK